MTRGSAITRPTVIRESSEAIGSWKMNCICGRILSMVLVSASSRCTGPSSGWRKMTSPPVGSSSRMMVRPVVDLPQPDSPTMATVSPRLTLSETPSTAFTWPITRRIAPPLMGKCFFRPRTSSNGPSAGSRGS